MSTILVGVDRSERSLDTVAFARGVLVVPRGVKASPAEVFGTLAEAAR